MIKSSLSLARVDYLDRRFSSTVFYSESSQENLES
jgi:hypothetical protein